METRTKPSNGSNGGTKDLDNQELNELFKEERKGWKGYVEWEDCPEKKRKAAEVLAQHEFDKPPEFQMMPLPQTNPILEGKRFKQYHAALGSNLDSLVDISWKYVLEEKSKDMIHVLQFPYNGEPPRDRLVQTELTANEDHFVRNHGGVPEIDKEEYFVDVGGFVKNPMKLTLSALQDETRFPRQSSVVTLQCSGTRRIEQIQEYPGDGDELINAPWAEGAIGTARYTGVSLKKIIKHCGGLVDGADHVEFYGADTYFKKGHVYNYVVSVPWRKIKLNEVMVAWEMNGKPLPRIHGYPLRVVVFGYIGARSCKWLYKIKGIKGPSKAPVQMKEYLYYTPQVGKQNAMYSNGFSIQDMPVSSAIMSPIDKKVVIHDGKIHMSGWAYSGGGHWPIRVEVSGDGGSVWYEVPYERLTQKYFHAWRLWSIELPVDAEGWLELCVRCWDNALNTQPTFVRSAWNWDLHVTSSCHRIKVYSVNKQRQLTRERLEKLSTESLDFEPLTRPLEVDLETEQHYNEEMTKRGGRDPIE